MFALRSLAAPKVSGATVSARRSVVVRSSNVDKADNPTENNPIQSTIDYARTLPGITEPFPEMFDPAGFLQTASIKDVRRWRESEITHGRVSMLAALGFIVQEQLQDFPLFYNFDGRVSGPAIYHFQQVGQGFSEPLLIGIGIAESYRVAIGWANPTGTGFNALRDDYEPGNLGFDPLNLKPTEPAALKDMQSKELNNGRLAMLAIAAFVAQELVEQTEIFEHLFLRFEKEAILELEDVERDLNLPVTPLPDNLKDIKIR